MVGRLLLIFILAVLPVYGVLALNCNTDDETTCKTTAGCQWNPELLETPCKKCDADSFCENGQPNPCPTNFPNSDTGAASSGECYKKPDGGW